MKLDKYIAISGFSGLHELINTRNNGLIVKDPDNDKSRFVSTRKHQFTPLATVAIYTYDDATELKIIFKKMHDLSSELPVIDPKKSGDEIKEYFEKILPDFDKERVHVSDIKKVIKWYNFLNERNLLDFSSDEEE